MIQLTTQQLKSLNKFREFNYLVIYAPRRAGKTQLLRYIMEMPEYKNIALFTLHYQMFKIMYGDMVKDSKKLITYKREPSVKYDLIVGDEVEVPQTDDTPTISALTKMCLFDVWGLDHIDKEGLEELERSTSKKYFLMEFGQYGKEDV